MNNVTVGLDCTGESFSVAVLQEGNCLAQAGGLSTRAHLRMLLPQLAACLERAGLTYQDIQTLAVTTSPGSFTGLRLGVVTARTMAQVLSCQLVSVNTLEALALNAPGQACVLAALDARRGEVFAAFFDTTGGHARRLSEDQPYQPAELKQAMARYSCRVALGNGAIRFSQELSDNDVCILPEYYGQIQATVVAALGAEAARQGHTVQPFELVPGYLRSGEVQVQGYKEPARLAPQVG